MSLLEAYKKKRELEKSGEPKAIIHKTPERIFVIHEHHASHLHWDLRLSMSGVLKSWALPKEPPRSKHLRRLAVQVEDHPRGYADFEGEIKEGYGKGIVKIWDKGTYELIEKTPSKIVIEIKGKKLTGKYALINAKLSGDKKNWLFMRV